MNYEEALRKAALCLKLAQSSNVNEAALAAAKAQEIIDRYQLDVNALNYDSAQAKEDAEPIVDFGWQDPLEAKVSKHTAGTLRLASIVSRQNGCRNILSKHADGYSKVIRIVGRPKDVQTARYVFAMLKNEIEGLIKKCCNAGTSKGYKDQFFLGCVDAIQIKFAESRKATISSLRAEHANNPMALVRVNSAIARMEKKTEEVFAFMRSTIPGLRTSRSVGGVGRAGFTGREHGRREGAGIRIGSATGSLGQGRKELQ